MVKRGVLSTECCMLVDFEDGCHWRCRDGLVILDFKCAFVSSSWVKALPYLYQLGKGFFVGFYACCSLQAHLARFLAKTKC
eukprot:scaffold4399_cov267-Chaetoceros_neogracile.AAC.2